MRLDSYPSYKQSGISWYEDIPQGWDVKPLFALANECSSSNKGMIEDNLLSLSYGKVINKNINSNDGLLPESFETYQVVESDDIVLRLTDLQNDKRSLRSAIVKERGIITSAYLAIRPTNIHPTFLNYLLRAYDLTKVFYSMGGGLRQSMKFSDVKRLPLILPSLEEQKTISMFLDSETTKIDALVAAQQKLIELLKEKRQAVISHSVTKGLDPTVKMKDSGVDWLGEVSKDWKLTSIKYVSTIVGRIGFRGYTKEDIVEEGNGAITLSPGNLVGGDISLDSCTCISWEKFNESPEIKIAPGDIVMVKTGSSYGKVAIFDKSDLPDITINPQLVIFKNVKINTKFFYYLLTSNYINSLVRSSNTGGTIPTLTQEFLGNIKIANPSIEEQNKIVDYLDNKHKKFSLMINESEKVIDLLNERKSALITAAITGQIDVRNYQPKEVA